VDLVFKALADEHRRTLLDALFEHDGQTLSDLCSLFPAMTRFGVMKHLDVLANAGLVVTRRDGREKFHYLNPVPIAEISDRWVSKYAAPFATALVHLKSNLEQPEGKRRAKAPASA
jgi:DNA-binding transcriptional ArsR family regulator